MDPADPYLRTAAAGANPSGRHHPHNTSCHVVHASYPHHSHPPYTSQGFTHHPHAQTSAAAAASMIPPHHLPPNGHQHRASPPNAMPMSRQHDIQHRASPYSNQSNNLAPPIGIASQPFRYSPNTLPQYAAPQPNGNRIALPPLGRKNTVTDGAVTLDSGESNTFNSVDMSVNNGYLGGVGQTVANVAGLAHSQLMNMSSAQQHATATRGNSNTNPTVSAFTQISNQPSGSQSVSGFPAGGGGGASSGGNYSCQSLEPVTLPQPEIEPEPPLPSLPKIKDPIKLNHHPDLPFLVTHWVDHYAAGSAVTFGEGKSMDLDKATTQAEEQSKKKEAILRLQRAAKDMAWAFETLGAFGDSTGGLLTLANDLDLSSRRTTYTDLKRKYGHVLSSAFASDTADNHNANAARVALLDSLVTASSSASNEASKCVMETVMPWSLLEAAYEGTVPTSNPVSSSGKTSETRQASSLGVGRRVGESSSDPADESLDDLLPSNESAGSTIQNPVLMGVAASNATGRGADCTAITSGKLAMTLGSNVEAVTNRASEASRKYLSIRTKLSEDVNEFQKTRAAMKTAITRAETSGSGDQFDASSDLDQHRVIVQLQRRLGEMHLNISTVKKEATDAKREADKAFQELSSIHSRYIDPYQTYGRCQFSMRRIALKPILMRSGCLSQVRQRSNFALSGVITQQYQGRRMPSDLAHSQLSILKSRFSHAVTINCHLVYPIYCLKFDKTGKYFITGSDDQLVKLFHLGAGPKNGERPAGKRFSYGANMRGAVLCCTLRGHAGVVTDIDVSSDNALLATASADGDVRVWGLRDGCPVAILRGHKEANMVSWSLLTPYRLVTCGDDGLARMWDVRKAALKRYGDMVGNRADYNLPDQKDDEDETGAIELDSEMLPPVPMPQQNPLAPNANAGSQEDADVPPGVAGNPIDNRGNPGDFVASDEIDEGVTLIARMQHGDIVHESQQGVGTRARRKAVKVMCIARCPIGGHFATGSDDGLGRIWADSDDQRIENLDSEMNKLNDNTSLPSAGPMFTRVMHSERQKTILGSPSAPSKERLLATLSGHNNAITDMKYSSTGDRILTASLKDGVVRVWSWQKETPIVIDGHLHTTTYSSDFKNSAQTKFMNMAQLLIRLTPVVQGENQEGEQSSRRKGLSSAANNTSSVHCDGVTWTCDDAKIVTSQSSPAKATGTEIVPGSQMIYVWDSVSGRCLLGIYGAHTSLCSTLISHPFIPSVVVSAGADGLLNAWDLNKGECFCTHKNVLSHGPVENAAMRGKQCSFLEGQFGPDGLHCILSDEAGRVSIFDIMANQDSFVPPLWMVEQYFANDYYELFYDSNGYCIERGSERPPHLAPKGVRCNHEGVGIAESVRDTFVNISGPLVLSANAVRWSRNDIRTKHHSVHRDGGVLSRNMRKKATTLVESPGLLVGCETTAIITPDGKLYKPKEKHSMSSMFGATSTSNRQTGSTSSGRTLSNRYTWVDYNDIADEDFDDHYDDSDDEEYRGDGRRISGGQENEDHDLSGVESDGESPVRINRSRQRNQGQQQRRQRRSTGQQNRSNRQAHSTYSQEQAQPTRASSRQASRRTSLPQESENEDEEFFEEVLSTHTKPSGSFAQDWLSADHFFKLPRDSEVHRKWLCRTNNQGSHFATKQYCPQVGDSIVYIPRAHYDTLQRYPTGDAYTCPWKSWPTHQPWPVVRCKVVHVRYRFPYEMYYASGRRKNDGLKDVAAILTLEITGVPYSCDNRMFPWPAPVFTAPIASRTRSHESTFEVTVFDSGLTDFIIPEFLYKWRIKGLEKAIAENHGEVSNLSVTINYPPDGRDQDGKEDPFYVPYEAELIDYAETDEHEFHFQGSGYNALTMNWADSETDEEPIPVCSWDIQVNDALKAPKVPAMSAETGKAVNAALKQIMSTDPKIKEWYDSMPDTRIYSDYLLMIEIPMYLSKIRLRLQNGYYSNKNSVVADIELIKENCYKYNEDNNDFYELACQMHTDFKTLVDAIPEDPAADDSDESDQETILRRGQGISRAMAASSSSQQQQQQRLPNRSRRILSQQQSSLANLPADGGRALRRSTRSIGNPEAGNETVESVESIRGDNESSNRISRRVRGAASTREESRPTRHSSRSQIRRTYTEEESDQVDDNNYSDSEEEVQPARNIRATRTSQRSNKRAACTRESEDDQVQSPSPSRSARRSTRSARRETTENDDSDSEEEVQPARNIRATRTSQRSNKSAAYAPDESEDDQVKSPSPSRAARRSTRSIHHETTENMSTRGTRSRGSLAVDSPSRKQSNRRATVDEESEDYNESEEASDDYEEESPAPKKQVKIRARVGKMSTERTSRKSLSEKQPSSASNNDRQSRRRANISYAEMGSDDEEYYEFIEEEVNPKKKRSRSQLESLEYSDDNESPQKKRGKTSPSRTRGKKGITYYPSLTKWPDISSRSIKKVGRAVLSLLRERDQKKLFAAPVAEMYPEIADSYLDTISDPMDFRTIEDVRLDKYRHIHELQDDLILTFRNCCVFNGEYSDFYEQTIQIWKSLNELFKEACDDNHVNLPQRFS